MYSRGFYCQKPWSKKIFFNKIFNYMHTKYIIPNVVIKNSFKEIKEVLEKKGDDFDYLLLEKHLRDDKSKLVENFLERQKGFVLGEPGTGKTRFLKELYKKVDDKYNKIFLDLKNAEKDDLINYINDEGEKNFFYEKKDGQVYDKNIFKNKEFKLSNDKNTYLFLDALDEVSIGRNFSTTVENIQKIADKYPDTKIFISCRVKYYNEKIYESNFTFDNFDFVGLKKFDRKQISDYLKEKKFNSPEIDDIFDKLYYREESILKTIRYLKFVSEIWREDVDLQKKGYINRSDIFDRVINKELAEEKRKDNDGTDAEQIKDVLGKIALIMELKQTNIISKKDLEIVFDDLKSDNKNRLLSRIDTETLYKKTLLKDNINTIEFKNVEFQEYLASLEISKLGDISRVVFDLLYEKYLGSEESILKFSCLPTLRFLIEQHPKLFFNILMFELRRSTRLGVVLGDIFELIQYANYKLFNQDEKGQILKSIFTYNQNNGKWLHDISFWLTDYFDEEYDLLEEYYYKTIKDQGIKRVVRTNLFSLVRYLNKKDKLSKFEQKKWIRRAKLSIGGDEVISEVSVGFLRSFNNLRLLSAITKKVTSTGEDRIVASLIRAYQDVDSNNIEGIKLFIDSIKRFRLRNSERVHSSPIYAEGGLSGVNKKDSILYLLNQIIIDKKFFDIVFGLGQYHMRGIFSDRHRPALIQNINKNYTVEIKEKILKVINRCNKESYISNVKFLSGLVSIIEKHDPGFIFKFTKSTKDIYKYKQTIVDNLKLDQVERLVNSFKKDEYYSLYNIFIEIRRTRREEGDRIYEEAIKFIQFPESSDLEDAEYNNFKKKYEINFFEAIELLYHNIRGSKLVTEIEKYVPEETMLDIKRRCLDFILQNNPIDFFIREKVDDVGQRKCTYTSFIRHFSLCLKFLNKSDLHNKSIRNSVLNFLPFANHFTAPYDTDFESVYNLLGDLSDDEISKFLKQVEKEDYREDLIDGIILLSKNKTDSKLVTFLKKFINNSDVSSWKKIECYEALSILGEKKDYFLSQFHELSENTDEEIDIKQRLNKIIIIKFQDLVSINWRIERVKKCKFEHHHDWSDWKEPFNKIENKGKAIVSLFLKLLDYSFSLSLTHEKRSGLLNIVYIYFNNLKIHKDYGYINMLVKRLKDHENKPGYNWFEYEIDKLKKDYSLFLGQACEINEYIKKYNEIKNKKYLMITNDYELFEKTKEALDRNFRKWIEGGAYDLVGRNTGKQEDLIQKTIVTQIENLFLKMGIEVKVFREIEGVDSDQVDLLISYNFIKPVAIELKRYENSDGLKKEYREQLLKYMKANCSEYLIYALFQDTKTSTEKKYLPIVKKIYEKDDNIEILSYVCLSKSKTK